MLKKKQTKNSSLFSEKKKKATNSNEISLCDYILQHLHILKCLCNSSSCVFLYKAHHLAHKSNNYWQEVLKAQPWVHSQPCENPTFKYCCVSKYFCFALIRAVFDQCRSSSNDRGQSPSLPPHHIIHLTKLTVPLLYFCVSAPLPPFSRSLSLSLSRGNAMIFPLYLL